MFLDYEVDYDQTNIDNNLWEIGENLANGTMPLIGTTELDTEGIELIQKYLTELE